MKKWILAALAAAVLTGGALTVSAINGSTLAAPVSANTANSTASQSQTISCPYHENCPNDGNCDGTPNCPYHENCPNDGNCDGTPNCDVDGVQYRGGSTANSTASQSQTASCPYHENCPNDGNCDGTPDRDGNGAQYRHHGENCGSGCHQGRK